MKNCVSTGSPDTPRRRVWYIVKEWVLPVLLYVAAFLAVFLFGLNLDYYHVVCALPSEPETCALCGGERHNAPCIVDLRTGEVGELTVYEPDPNDPAEIAEKQLGGTFSFIFPAGLTGTRDKTTWTATVDVPRGGWSLRLPQFCRSCRHQLVDRMEGRYILADLYDLENMTFRPLWGDTTYTIRDYTVSVEDDGDEYHVTVQGLRTPSPQGEGVCVEGICRGRFHIGPFVGFIAA